MDEHLINEEPEQFSVCLRVRSQLQDYIEGYLDVVAAETIRAHLAVCALCHREYYELAETIRLVSTLPYLSPPGDAAERVMQAIGQRKKPWWRWRPTYRR